MEAVLQAKAAIAIDAGKDAVRLRLDKVVADAGLAVNRCRRMVSPDAGRIARPPIKFAGSSGQDSESCVRPMPTYYANSAPVTLTD